MKTQEEAALEKAIAASLAEQNKLIAEQQSVEEKYGVQLDNVPPNGNCFYSAVAKQLKLNNLTSDLGDLNHDDLRRIAIEHLTLNKDVYKSTDQQSQLIIASYDKPDGAAKDYENYLAIHSKDGEYADQGMVSALSRALKINIVILQPEIDPIIQKQNHDESALYIYYNKQHYQSAIPEPDNPHFTILAKQVKDHPIDELTDFQQNTAIGLHYKESQVASVTVSPHRTELELLEDIHASIQHAMDNPNITQKKETIINALKQIKTGDIQPQELDALYANFEKQRQTNLARAVTKLVENAQEKAVGFQSDNCIKPVSTPKIKSYRNKSNKEI